MVWPNFFLMNVFFALKGSKLFIIIDVYTLNLLSLTILLEWQLYMFPCVLYVRYVLTVYTGETKINDTYLLTLVKGIGQLCPVLAILNYLLKQVDGMINSDRLLR